MTPSLSVLGSSGNLTPSHYRLLLGNVVVIWGRPAGSERRATIICVVRELADATPYFLDGMSPRRMACSNFRAVNKKAIASIQSLLPKCVVLMPMPGIERTRFSTMHKILPTIYFGLVTAVYGRLKNTTRSTVCDE